MILGALALMGGVALTPGADSDVDIDLYLVAGNSKVVRGMDLLKGTEEGGVESVLRSTLGPLAKSKTSFILVDGGDCSVFAAAARSVAISHREYSSYDSMTQSVTIKGKTKTQVLARSESESTTTTTLEPKPLKKGSGYISQSYEYFGPSGEARPSVTFQDLNSFQASVDRGDAEERATLGRTIAITGDSVDATKAFLAKHQGVFNGICICPWGLQDKSAPNVIVFPPAGIVGHYKLYRHNTRWGVSLVEYLGVQGQGAYSFARGTSSTR